MDMENSANLLDKRMSRFVGIGMVVGFLLPHSSTTLLLINPLLCIFYKCFKQNKIYYKKNWIVIIPILLSLFINYPQGVEMKALLSCVTILLYFFCFPIIGKVSIPNIFFYIILSVIVLSQLAYVLNISFLVNILDTYYPFSEDNNAIKYMKSTITVDNMLNYRMGGLYRNSNQCSRFLTFLLAGFLILNHEKNVVKLLPFVIVALLGVILTGSRTGFVVAGLMVILYTFVNKQIPTSFRYLATFIFVLYFIILLVQGTGEFRSTSVAEGMGSSMKSKYETLMYYLSTEHSAFRLLFGYLDVSHFESGSEVMDSFDSDVGFIIYCFGFIGMICILIYFYYLFKRMNKYGRIYSILLLWMFSSTIVTSFRAFFLFMLILSCIYNQNKWGASNSVLNDI